MSYASRPTLDETLEKWSQSIHRKFEENYVWHNNTVTPGGTIYLYSGTKKVLGQEALQLCRHFALLWNKGITKHYWNAGRSGDVADLSNHFADTLDRVTGYMQDGQRNTGDKGLKLIVKRGQELRLALLEKFEAEIGAPSGNFDLSEDTAKLVMHQVQEGNFLVVTEFAPLD